MLNSIAQSPGLMLAEVGDVVKSVDIAFWIFWSFTAFVLLCITGSMIGFSIKYNRKTHKKTSQVEGNFKLEIVWTVIPTIIVIGMFFVGYHGFALMRDVPPNAKVIKVVGQQWFWTFYYPEEGLTTSRLVVPVNQPVKLEITSKIDDVMHNLYIPAFRIKEDAVPGMTTYLWFYPDRVDTFNVFCAEFCGKDHAQMITTCEVMEQGDYETWVKNERAERFKPVDMALAMDPKSDEIVNRDGEKIYGTYCATCHGIKGLGGLIEGARNFTILDKWKDETGEKEWISYGPTIPGIFRTLTEGIKGSQMRSFSNLPAWDGFAVGHHVQTFYEGEGWPKATAEEIQQLNEDYMLDQQRAPKERIPIDQAIEAILDESTGQ